MAQGQLIAKGGLRLSYRGWETASPKGICLLVHGLAEHSGRYERAARVLNRHGFSVWALDNRGHGRSEGLRGDCRSLDEMVQDVAQLGCTIRALHPSLPQVMVGHSLGGLIALACAARFPERLKAVAVSSPALRLTHETSLFTAATVTTLSRVLPTTPFANGVDPAVLCHDPKVVEAYRNDPLVHRVLTARCAVALRKAMRESAGLAEQIRIPCLLLQAGQDQVCDPAAAEQFARRAKNGLITFKRYDGLYHELFNEPQGEAILEEVGRWLDRFV